MKSEISKLTRVQGVRQGWEDEGGEEGKNMRRGGYGIPIQKWDPVHLSSIRTVSYISYPKYKSQSAQNSDRQELGRIFNWNK